MCGFKNPNIIYQYDYGLRLPKIEVMKILQEKSGGKINYYSFVGYDKTYKPTTPSQPTETPPISSNQSREVINV
jgi:hypothetical protein